MSGNDLAKLAEVPFLLLEGVAGLCRCLGCLLALVAGLAAAVVALGTYLFVR